MLSVRMQCILRACMFKCTKCIYSLSYCMDLGARVQSLCNGSPPVWNIWLFHWRNASCFTRPPPPPPTSDKQLSLKPSPLQWRPVNCTAYIDPFFTKAQFRVKALFISPLKLQQLLAGRTPSKSELCNFTESCFYTMSKPAGWEKSRKEAKQGI